MLLPEGRDAGSVPGVLARIAVTARVCAGTEEVWAEVDNGVGALLLDAGMLTRHDWGRLKEVLDRQPSWSELPVILLLRRGHQSQMAAVALQLPGEVILVELPVRVDTLVSVVRSALRSRHRQYLVRGQLRAQNESFRTLFDAIDEGFCVVEVVFEGTRALDYRFLTSNPAFERHTGISNARGRTMREIAPDLEEYWFERYGHVALTGEPARFQSYAAQLQRWFDVYAFRVGPERSRQVAILFSDITDRKQADLELRQAKDELEVRVRARTEELSRALEKLREETEERLRAVEEVHTKDQLLMHQGRMAAMGEMIGFIAHQWRQPLNTLALVIQELSYLQKHAMLCQEHMDTSTSTAMQVINQMSRTVEDFRNFFKADREKASFRVVDILTNTINLVQAAFRDARITLEISTEDEIAIEGFANEYSQVILNILMNAKDALVERKVAQPRVLIRIFRENGRAVTTISDNAGGIPDEALERIFDPYFTTKGPEKGTGIGLYMAKIIIERNMGGRLMVQNVAGGAEFSIEV